jgi:flagellar protein FlaF
MGFSVTASTAVVFLAVLVAFGGYQSAATAAEETTIEASDDATELALDRHHTAVTVTNASVDPAGPLTVEIANEGVTTLSVDRTTLLVDNVYIEGTRTVEGDNTTDLWTPGETLNVTVPRTVVDSRLGGSVTRVVVATEYGVRDGAEVA